MIEDALNRTRQSYFLILAISGVSILFSFAIRPPEETLKKEEIVEKLIKVDLSQYDSFAKRKIGETISTYNSNNNLLYELDTLNLFIFGTDKILSVFKNLDYSGRLILSNSKFANLRKCNINDLNEINSLETSKNILLFIPEINSLKKDEIIPFLSSYNNHGLSVSNVSIEGIRSKNDASTYYALEDPSVSLYFELTSPVSRSGTPVFNTQVRGKVLEIPNSSLVDWITRESFSKDLILVDSDSIIWLAENNIFDSNESELTLSELYKNLNDRLDQYSPEKQKINFLGLEIPGAFFFLASPVLILMMIYFLFSNLSHLKRIISENRDKIKEFSWAALNAQESSYFEIVFVVFIAPILSLCLLAYNLFIAENFNWVLFSFIVVACVGCIFLGQKILSLFKNLRSKLNTK